MRILHLSIEANFRVNVLLSKPLDPSNSDPSTENWSPLTNKRGKIKEATTELIFFFFKERERDRGFQYIKVSLYMLYFIFFPAKKLHVILWYICNKALCNKALYTPCHKNSGIMTYSKSKSWVLM